MAQCVSYFSFSLLSSTFFFIKLRSHPELNCFRGLLSFTWIPGLSYGSQRFPAIVFPDFSALAHLRSSILSKFSSLLFPLTSDLLIPPCLDRRGAPPTYNVGALWMGSGFICAGNFFDRYSITCNVEDHARFFTQTALQNEFHPIRRTRRNCGLWLEKHAKAISHIPRRCRVTCCGVVLRLCNRCLCLAQLSVVFYRNLI